MLLSDQTLKEMLKSSGYGYGWNIRKESEFISIYGFKPTKYPQYFYVTPSGYVGVNQLFRTHCNNLFSQKRALTGMLTESPF